MRAESKTDHRLRVGELQAQLDVLLSMETESMKAAAERRSGRQGVYAISDPADEEIVYVGMSKNAKGGVGQRLGDHLKNQEASVLKSMLGGDKKLAERYLVRIVEEADYVTRRNLEAFAIAVLSPKFNK